MQLSSTNAGVVGCRRLDDPHSGDHGSPPKSGLCEWKPPHASLFLVNLERAHHARKVLEVVRSRSAGLCGGDALIAMPGKGKALYLETGPVHPHVEGRMDLLLNKARVALCPPVATLSAS